jgi:rhomboid protease GluP
MTDPSASPPANALALRPIPWLTLSVFVLTSLVTAAMTVWPALGPALERTPAMVAGEPWRFVTTWLVPTDGWPQILVNSIGLLAFGIGVERQIGRAWWIIGYVVAGLGGEIAGIYWQPVGGGNSVAICGLIALYSTWQIGRTQLAPSQRYLSAIVWFGAGIWLLTRSDIHGAALLAGFIVGGAAFLRRRRKGMAHG